MKSSVVYRLADIPSRFFALLIDGAVVGAIGGALGANNSFFLSGVVSLVVGVGYQWIFLTRNHGQTPGKMLLGIRVVKVDGSEITDLDAVMRYIGYTINSALLMLGWIWAFIDTNQQGFHDKLARTYVIKVEKDENSDEIKIKRSSEFYDEDDTFNGQ
jgi:uncharacterized RDD family membrane protein YckC